MPVYTYIYIYIIYNVHIIDQHFCQLTPHPSSCLPDKSALFSIDNGHELCRASHSKGTSATIELFLETRIRTKFSQSIFGSPQKINPLPVIFIFFFTQQKKLSRINLPIQGWGCFEILTAAKSTPLLTLMSTQNATQNLQERKLVTVTPVEIVAKLCNT